MQLAPLKLRRLGKAGTTHHHPRPAFSARALRRSSTARRPPRPPRRSSGVARLAPKQAPRHAPRVTTRARGGNRRSSWAVS